MENVSFWVFQVLLQATAWQLSSPNMRAKPNLSPKPFTALDPNACLKVEKCLLFHVCGQVCSIKSKEHDLF